MSRIFWDTNLFVYLLEDRGELAERVVSLRKRMIVRNDELLTSTLTLGEILVKPLEAGDETLARRYEQAITAAATVIPFDPPAAYAFATVRRDRTISASGRDPARLRLGGGRRHVHHQRPPAQPKGGSRGSLHPVARDCGALTRGEPH